MQERIKVAECDVSPQSGCSLEDATDENSVRRFIWKRSQGSMTLPGEIEIEAVPYVGPADSTGYLVSVFEAPKQIEGMS